MQHDRNDSLQISRPEVPEGFITGPDGQLQRRASVALPTHMVLFGTLVASALGLYLLALDGDLSSSAMYLIPASTIVAAFLGANVARWSWPRNQRGSPLRASVIGLMISLPILGLGLAASAVAA